MTLQYKKFPDGMYLYSIERWIYDKSLYINSDESTYTLKAVYKPIATRKRRCRKPYHLIIRTSLSNKSPEEREANTKKIWELAWQLMQQYGREERLAGVSPAHSCCTTPGKRNANADTLQY